MAKMTTTVYKWENGRVIEVNRENKNPNTYISEEQRKEKYERERHESIKGKKGQQ